MKFKDAVVDPAVARTKFEREVALYRENSDDYIARGWWMIKAEFPEVAVAFATPTISPPMAPFGALIDFTNYDAWPPSVRLVNPFTQAPFKASEVPIPLLPRRRNADNLQLPQHENLLQSEAPEAIPFICVPGIREYHEHPAHSGDSWFVYRNRGEGTLYFILNLLGTYGLGAITGYSFNMQINVGLQGPNNPDEIPA